MRSPQLSAQDRQLLPQQEDLELLRTLRSAQQHNQLQQAAEHQIDERPNHAEPPDLKRRDAIAPTAKRSGQARDRVSEPHARASGSQRAVLGSMRSPWRSAAACQRRDRDGARHERRNPVKAHVSRMLTKLGVDNRVQIALLGQEQGEPDPRVSRTVGRRATGYQRGIATATMAYRCSLTRSPWSAPPSSGSSVPRSS